MSGNGASQQQTSNPWAPAVPYLNDIMGKGKGLYDSTAPSYTNPASNFGYNPTTGAVGSIVNGTGSLGTLANSTGAGTADEVNRALTGQPDYTAVSKAISGANQQQWDDFYNTQLPQLNQRASFLGNGSGAIKDLNSTVTNMQRNQSMNADQAYLGTYNAAQDRALQAAGLGGQFATGAGSQALQGASLYPELANMPQQELQDYANLIATTGGKYGNQTTSTNPGSGATLSNIVGGLTTGAGLIGAGSKGYDAVKSWLNKGSTASTAATTAADAASAAGIGSAALNAGGAAGLDAAIADGGLSAATAASSAEAAAAIGADSAGALGGGLGSGAAAGGGGSIAGGGAGGAAEGAAAAQGGLGAAAGAAAAVAIPAAVIAFGASRQPYDIKASYWKQLGDTLVSGTSGNSTYDKAVPPAQQIYQAKNGLYSMIQKAGVGGNLTGSGFGQGGNAIPAKYLDMAKGFGMINPDGSINKNWSQPAPAAARYSAYGKLMDPSTNTIVEPTVHNAGGPGGRAY